MSVAISLPLNFFDLPQVAHFILLATGRGKSELEARALAVLLWMSVANGEGDSLPYNPEIEFARQTPVILLAAYCRWPGDPADLLRLAMESGMLARPDNGDLVLVCKGFSDFNTPKSKARKARGAFGRVVKLNDKKAHEDAAAHLDLWKRTGGGPAGWTADTSRRVLAFVHNCARALDADAPNEEALRELLEPAAAIVAGSVDARLNQRVLMWVIAVRKSDQRPKNLRDLILNWSAFRDKADLEI
jgi:hypothetical protein